MQAKINTICLVLLATATTLTALYVSRDLVAPILCAIILGIVLTPLSDLWDKLRVPAAVAALLSVLLALALIFLLLVLLEPYVTQAISQAPVIREELRETVGEVRRLLRGLEEISDEVAATIEPEGNQTAKEDAMALPSLTDALFYAPQFLSQFLIFTGTLYFFLMARDAVYEWLSKSVSALYKTDLRHAGKRVSQYVLTITAINFGLGMLVSLAMQLIGMPSPMIWGLLAFVLNFILYLGPSVLIVTLTIAGIVVFDGAASFLPPAVYVVMNAVEAQFVTPTLVGRSLSVNPLLIFLALVFWLWLWGPIGGIIAIPLLIWILTIAKGFSEETSRAKAANQI